jgi:uncharacterized protein (TIGR02246 family)
MQTDEQAIRNVIATWITASAAGDITTLAGLMDEDVVFLTAGHPPMRGRDTFLAAQASVLRQMQIDAASEIREIRVDGDWAWCWGHLVVSMTPARATAPIRRAGDTLSIFRKNADGTWVLFRDANLLAPETQNPKRQAS